MIDAAAMTLFDMYQQLKNRSGKIHTCGCQQPNKWGTNPVLQAVWCVRDISCISCDFQLVFRLSIETDLPDRMVRSSAFPPQLVLKSSKVIMSV